MKNKILIIFLALLFGLIYFVIHYQEQFIGLEHFDEGIRVFSAQNILEGKLPYRDFISLYPPGYFAYIALIFKLFGTTLLNHRMAELFLHSIVVALVIYLCSDNTSFIFGILVALTLLIFPTNIGVGSLIFVFLCYILFLKFIKSGNKLLLFLSGLACGFTSFFRIDFALYCLLSCTITAIIHSFHQRKMNLIALLYSLIPFMIGFSFGFVPLLTYAWKAGWYNTWQNLIIFSHATSVARALPYPSLLPNIVNYLNNILTVSFQSYFQQVTFGWIFYLPFFLITICIADLLLRRKVLYKTVPGSYYLRILLIVSIILFSIYMRYRADIEHSWTVYFFVFSLFPLACESLYHLLKKFTLLRDICLLLFCFLIIIFWNEYFIKLFIKYALLSSAVLLIFIIYYRHKITKINPFFLSAAALFFIFNLILLDHYRIFRTFQSYPQDPIAFDVPRAGNIYVSGKTENDYLNLARYIRAVTVLGEPILSGSIRHDMVFINDILLYFLTNTKSATKYWMYDPGRQTSLPVQKDMVTELSYAKPRYIVLWLLGSSSNEPNLSSKSSGVFIFDNYLKDNYVPTKQFGYYLVLERRENI